MQRIKKAAATISGWDCTLLTFIYPGFDCGSSDEIPKDHLNRDASLLRVDEIDFPPVQNIWLLTRFLCIHSQTCWLPLEFTDFVGQHRAWNFAESSAPSASTQHPEASGLCGWAPGPLFGCLTSRAPLGRGRKAVANSARVLY